MLVYLQRSVQHVACTAATSVSASAAADKVCVLLLLLLLLLLLQFNDICWRGAPHDFKGLDKVFPTGTISFAGWRGMHSTW
jgi:hypothetical protein